MAPYKRRQTDDAPEMAAEPNSENQVRTEDADATQETASVQEAEVVKPVRRRRRTACSCSGKRGRKSKRDSSSGRRKRG